MSFEPSCLDGRVASRSWVFSWKRLALALLAGMLAGTPSLRAQAGYNTATLKGTISDPKGSPVASATVTVKNAATGVSKAQKADADGTYRLPALPPGTYQLTVAASGFSTAVAENLVLTVGATVIYDVHLKVGGIREVVEVTDRAPLIETEQTQQANTVDTRQVANLPNINLSFTQAIYTVPGVVSSAAPTAQDSNIGTGYLSSGFSIGGSNGRNNLFTIDGGEDDFGSGALRVNHVPIESIQEYQVNRNSYAAEFGFTVGTAINVVTKRGTNKYHGSVYGFLHNRKADAANFFNSFSPNPNTKPFEQGLIAGGTFGGPIVKGKLFFFTSYERQKLDSPTVVNLLGTTEAIGVSAQSNGFNGATCPGQPQQVSQLCYLTQMEALGGTINGIPLGGPTGVAAGLLNSPVFNPLTDPIFKALLAPNSGTFDGNAGLGAQAGGETQAPPGQNGRYNNWVTRLDYLPSQKDNVSLRFSLMREFNQVTGPGGAQRYWSDTNSVVDYTATFSWTRTLGNNTVNEMRAQVVPHDTSDNVAPFPHRAEILLGNLSSVGTPFPYPYFGHENRFQFDENLFVIKGAHSFKIGASYRPVDYNVYEELWFGGQYKFVEGLLPIIGLFQSAPPIQTALATYNFISGYDLLGPHSTDLTAAESYVAGVPLSLLQANGNGLWKGWAHYLGLYAQDSWKVSPRLTANYGVRFDYDREASPVPHTFYASPRVGLAFDARGDGKTVVRAAGGLFVAPQIFLIPFYLNDLGADGKHINLALQTIAQAGGVPLLTATFFEQSSATLANPNPELSAQQLAAAGINIVPVGPNQFNGVFYTIQDHFKPQYSIQASASVAQQIRPDLSLEIGYNMYRGVHIQQNQEANYIRDTAFPVDPFIGPFYAPKPGSTAGEPNAQVLQNNQFASIGSSIYHGMTASLTKRFSRGLQFQVNYTWSKAIDNTSDYSSLSTPFRPDLVSADRSLSDFNITHNFVANAVYTTPYKAQGSSFSKLLADISISPIIYARSGVPFTLLVPGLGGFNGNFAGSHTSEARPFHEGRNLGIGPAYYSWDMRISKSLFLNRDSGMRLDLIAQATDILNHTNFSFVNNTFPASESVQTGRGTVDLLNGPYRYTGFAPRSAADLDTPLSFGGANPPRQISFALRFEF